RSQSKESARCLPPPRALDEKGCTSPPTPRGRRRKEGGTDARHPRREQTVAVACAGILQTPEDGRRRTCPKSGLSKMMALSWRRHATGTRNDSRATWIGHYAVCTLCLLGNSLHLVDHPLDEVAVEVGHEVAAFRFGEHGRKPCAQT